MAYSKEDLLTLPGAEVVGGNVIQGELADRAFVGKINDEGVFYITPEGEARLAARAASAVPASVASEVQAVLEANTNATVTDLQTAEDEISTAISKKK